MPPIVPLTLLVADGSMSVNVFAQRQSLEGVNPLKKSVPIRTSAGFCVAMPAGCVVPVVHAAPGVAPAVPTAIMPKPNCYGHAVALVFANSEGVQSYISSGVPSVTVTCWNRRFAAVLFRAI